ncbi:hypothetical protein OG323_22625 [Streptomyces cyaneofuscatus]|uniref:hypothetical protein n=1 Tax=Streptomyces cyaneofuscatus TaxID=66883 RepID=UPI003865889F|nr:hypothetical protein OG323_22625 [Streptomyces cyaneofuscatus]
MEIAKLVLDFVKVLAWPAFAATLLWILRGKIKDIADRLTRVETPAGSAEFAAAAAHVLDEAQEVALAGGSGIAVGGDIRLSVEPSPVANQEEAADSERGQDDGDAAPESSTGVLLPDDVVISKYLSALSADKRAAFLAGAVLAGGPFDEAMATVNASPRGAVVEAWLVLESRCRAVLNDHGLIVKERYPNPMSTERGLKELGLPDDTLKIFRQLRELRNRAVHSGEAIGRPAAEDFVRSCRTVARELERFR